MTYVHISDMHLVLKGDDMFRDGASFKRLEALFEDIAYRGVQPDVFLISGDICFHEDAACYEKARTVIEQNIRFFDAPAVVALGNHDNAQAFRQGYLGETGGHEPYFGETQLGDVRILALDSRLIKGQAIYQPTGIISEEQLAWLKAKLSEPTLKETLIMFHHPPVQIPTERRELMGNADALFEVLSGSKVSAILCGHTHEAAIGSRGGILYSVAPGALNGRISSKQSDKVSITRESGYNIGFIKDGALTIQTKYVNPERKQDRAFKIEDLENKHKGVEKGI